jgi:endonuclease-8
LEGPSIYLATEWLAPFVGKAILVVGGNTHFGKERLNKKKVLDIFSWGKHLVFQFDDFAVRVHFMLFGSFQASVKGTKVTGDYPKKNVAPRLELNFNIGEITLYSCSLKYLETSNAKELYDFSTDIMSSAWDPKKAFEKIKDQQDEEIADLLLDQSIFSGVGNIIKNEVLFLVKKKPTTFVREMTNPQLKKLIKTAREFSFQFYNWRKKFELKKHYRIYRKKVCPLCGEQICKKWTGIRNRVSFFCLNCQK